MFIGRIVDGGLALDEMADLERNIRSIVVVTFSLQKASGALRVFAIEREELTSGLAAASRSPAVPLPWKIRSSAIWTRRQASA